MSRGARHVLVLTGCLAAVVPGAMLLGSSRVAPGALLGALRGPAAHELHVLLWEIRVPRVLLGALVGAALAASGAALQEWLQNPLVEPGIGGVSSGAALCAVLALYGGLSIHSALAVPAAAMAGALGAALAVAALAGRDLGNERVLLAGLALTTACNAAIALVLNLSPNPLASLELTFWLLGSLADRSLVHLGWVLGPMALGFVLLLVQGRALRAWALGPEVAASLGVNPLLLRACVLLGTALTVGAAVSVSGTIGFVGLFVPHLLRRRVQGDAAWLVPASALAGAILLVLADAAVRVSGPWMQGIELKVGVMTALLGTPVLFLHALRGGRAWT